jgi:peptidoglycan/LPS O-acetylase OafA/YrhL
VTSPPDTTAVPAGIRRGTTYFPELESLRGIAIALVVAFHADAAIGFPFRNRIGSWPSPPLAFIHAGHSGVTLFFVLSAFLLALPFLEAAYGGRPASRPTFYRRRALRILPLYYAAVVVGTVLTARSLAQLWRGAPYLLFLESRGSLVTPMPPWSGVWWSLATEVQFYILLPLVALAFGRSRRLTLGLLALYAVGYVAVARGLVLPALEPWFRAQSVIGRGPIFLCGIGAAWLWLRHGERLRHRLAATRWLAAGGGDVLLLVVLLALGLLLRWATFHGFMVLESTPRFVWHVPEGVLWTLVLLIVLLVPLRSKALLSNRVLARLGVLSYSIYILHLPVFHYTMWPWRIAFPRASMDWAPNTATWFVLAAGLCVGLAVLTYRWIERPFLVRKARLDGGAAPAAHARAA